MCHFPLKLMNPTVNENKWAKRIESEDEKKEKKSWKGGGIAAFKLNRWNVLVFLFQ